MSAHVTASHHVFVRGDNVTPNTTQLYLQEQEQRVQDAKQRLEAQQAEFAAANISRPSSTAQMPLTSEASEGAVSLSAPVTMNDRQHRTAAALLASLAQTASRGRDRLGRLERVLNTIAADASEPEKVGQLRDVPILSRATVLPGR